MVKSIKKDKLVVNIYENRTVMGEAAANDIAACMEKLLAEKESINMVFAAAPSQNDVLESLLKKPLDWNRVNAFHMDEYVGLKKEDEQSFGNYLNEHIFKKVPFANIYYVESTAPAGIVVYQSAAPFSTISGQPGKVAIDLTVSIGSSTVIP